MKYVKQFLETAMMMCLPVELLVHYVIRTVTEFRSAN